MPYVITEPCIGVKDKSCQLVCPVDCIYEGPDMLYIHPDECIDCGLCEPECPVSAIFVDTDVPDKWVEYIEINRVIAPKLAAGLSLEETQPTGKVDAVDSLELDSSAK